MEKRYGERDKERNKERCGGIRKRMEENRKGQENNSNNSLHIYYLSKSNCDYRLSQFLLLVTFIGYWSFLLNPV